MADQVKIIFASHKPCPAPEDPLYTPLLVGASLPGREPVPGFLPDNTGENISIKNPCFGTQTGLFWAWKNLQADYIGLVHYRRFFRQGTHHKQEPLSGILTGAQMEALLPGHAVFVPKRRHYYIETIYSHYSHTMDPTQLDTLREILSRQHPEDLKYYDRVMKRRWGYMFNLMILRKDLLDAYCPWLFGLLFEAEKRIARPDMTEFEARFCGRLSERLFNVWLEKQLSEGKLLPGEICELPYTEEVHYLSKIRDFLGAKLFHIQYQRSN